MSELRKDPTPQQLFDRILKLESRLANLEMNSIGNMDLKSMRASIARLEDAFTDVTTRLFNHAEHLWAVVHTVFPTLEATYEQIDGIIKRKSPPAGKKTT